MNTQQEDERDTYRLIITRRHASELLCLPDGPYHSLPSVDIPRWERVSEQINKAAKDHLNFEAYSLFSCPCEPPINTTFSIFFQVMEPIRPDGPIPPTTFWIPIPSLTISSFRDPEDFRRISNALRSLSRHAQSGNESPFITPGWLPDLCSWIEQQIEPLKIKLTGNFRQLNANSSFSLIRFETTGSAVWFKAVGKPNSREFNIVSLLTTLIPEFLPHILAVRPEWNAWLMSEADGTSPDADSHFEMWNTISARLAALQIASVHETPRLMAAGCRDVSASSLYNCVDEFFAIMAELMKQQTKTPPSILTSAQLFHLKEQIKETLCLFAATRIPDALNHLDFNPGNIFISGGRCTFIDWTEAAIGHPFLTFQYLLEHLARLRPDNASRNQELASVYTSPWKSLASSFAISKALAVVPLAAVFAHAVSAGAWRDSQTFANPRTAGYFRSLVRRMKREADTLENRSLECTSV